MVLFQIINRKSHRLRKSDLPDQKHSRLLGEFISLAVDFKVNLSSMLPGQIPLNVYEKKKTYRIAS